LRGFINRLFIEPRKLDSLRYRGRNCALFCDRADSQSELLLQEVSSSMASIAPRAAAFEANLTPAAFEARSKKTQLTP
jgi:hypothetical protein